MQKLKKGIRRVEAMVLVLLLLVNMVDMSVFASGSQTISCENHAEHTAECGYTEGVEGSVCNHECSVESGCLPVEVSENGATEEAQEGEIEVAEICEPCETTVTYAAMQDTNGFTLQDAEADEYVYENGVLSIVKDGAQLTIANADPNTPTTDKIVVSKDVSANIILAGVNIDVSSTEGACAFKIEDDSTGNVIITLTDDTVNTLKSGVKCAGLQKNGIGDEIGTLTLQGEGSLTAEGKNFGAGIGGGYYGSGSKITISGGEVTATGGKYGAGIGGGYCGEGFKITISGGEVSATGGSDGAGIGGGYCGEGSKITISGGKVTATGGSDGAGIGGGFYGSGSKITISGGEVSATGGDYGAGIGGGHNGLGSNITISGGKVTATGGSDGAGIGGGYYGSGSNITISGGEVTATGEVGGAGIGGGGSGSGSNITISGGSVKAVAIIGVNQIGGGLYKESIIPTDDSGNPVYLMVIDNENGDPIKINDTEIMYKEHNGEKKVYVYLKEGTYEVKVGDNEALIYQFFKGANRLVNESSEHDFTITGGEVMKDYVAVEDTLYILSNTPLTIANTDPYTATTDKIVVAKDVSATITLAGINIDVSNIGTVCAFKIEDDSTGYVNIILADDTVNTLKSGVNYAGLQKNGIGDEIGTLTIQGKENGTGSLIATGGVCGAGIGGGKEESGSKITISGGKMTATGGVYGAGIGGGDYGSGSEIIISGGSVKAVAGSEANQIGGGRNYKGVTPTDGAGNPVYLMVIDNENGDSIEINGTEIMYKEHNGEKKVYIYLKDDIYEVKVGNKHVVNYYCIKGANSFITESSEHDFTIITDGEVMKDYVAVEGTLYILSSTPLTIANANPATATMGKIVIGKGVSTTITLAGVNIDVSGTTNACAFKIEDDSTGDVEIILADDTVNTLKSGGNCAGLQKNGAGEEIGTLTIRGGEKGTGSLIATGVYDGAGIGGGKEESGSKITISGGVVTATGGRYGAGIGGGTNGVGSKITISGGVVTATGLRTGAGIGGGSNGSGNEIVISGGIVTATGGVEDGQDYNRDETGAGIGGGSNGAASKITISGGEVTATGGRYGAGIGGGSNGAASEIIISGGSVKAVAGCYGNNIGGGQYKESIIPTDDSGNPVYLLVIDNENGDPIKINGTEIMYKMHNEEKKVYVYLKEGTYAVKVGTKETLNYQVIKGLNRFVNESSNHAFAITGGEVLKDYVAMEDTLYILTNTPLTIANTDPGTATTDKIVVAKDVSATLTLAGVNIDVSEMENVCAFKIEDDSIGNVTIILADDTENILKSGECCAGLQKNGIGDTMGTLTIQGEKKGSGSLTTTSGLCGAGIGGGTNGAGSKITISGGRVVATGGEGGAGIGGGTNGAGSKITISEGIVTTTGGYGGAGIGGGWQGEGSEITISEGIVTTTGGYGGAGIGGGWQGEGSEITISGGIVTTTGGEGGAGIGGGLQGEGSEITISGGSVKVVEGIDANLIGGGYPNKSVTPTDGLGNPVYLMELNNSAGADVTINGKAYPKQHSLEKQNIYVYLPAKTGANPNVVKVGSDTTKYCYDLTNLKWIEVIDIPEADDEVYVYNGSEQTYTLTQSEYYTISDNTTQTDVGTYRITVSLNDKINTVWSDGTTDDKEYKFIIKAVPEIGTVSSNMLENNLDINQIVLSRTDETIAGSLSLKEGTILQYGTNEYTYVFHSQDENYADIEGTVSITITDTIAPTAIYQIGTNGFKAFMNETTFGYFFKNTQTVEIEYTDDRTDNDGTIPVKGSGVQTKQYYIASEPVAEDAIADIEWEEYTQPISLEQSGKYFVYAKVTDYAGNTAIMNSEGIVIYEESVLKAASVEYIYKSNKNISFELDAKGNTFMALKDSKSKDVSVDHYIVTDNSKITFKAEYLDTLNVAEQPYTYKIYMNPQGVEGSNPESSKPELCYEITINVLAKELTVTGATATERTYEKENTSVVITGIDLAGKMEGDNVSVDVTGLTGTLSGADAGDYTEVILPKLELAGTDKGNYLLIQPLEAVSTSVTINPLATGTATSVTNKYIYSQESTDEINLEELLPKDCGAVVSYDTPSVEGNVTYKVTPSITNGTLSYTVAQSLEEAIGNKGTIHVNVKTQNYANVPVTITVELIDQTLVNPLQTTPYIQATPTATAITYGMSLNDSTLNGGIVQHSEEDTTTVEGTWSWKETTTKPVVADSDVTQYGVIFVPADAENYNKVEATVTLTVNKAPVAPNKPESTMSALFSQKTVSAVELPEGWVWSETDREKELTSGGTVEATAIYNGADKGNYVTESVTVLITCQNCRHEGETEVRDQKDATCAEEGYTGDTYCKDCETKIATGTKVDKITIVGEQITSQDGSATYKVTEMGENGNTVTYVGSTDKNAKTVVIPSTVTINNITYKVTAISATAFANNKKITSVTIGNNVTSIPSNAFKNFKNLVTVKIGSGVKTIGKNAFYGCSKLKNLTIGKNVVTIGDKAFYKCTSLTKLTIPSKVKKIGKSAFEGCKALKTITVGKSVTEIGAKAFYGCSKLKTLTIKSTKLTTKKIGSKAFGKTPKSVTVKVPKKKFNAYKSMLIKSGVNKKAKFKKS